MNLAGDVGGTHTRLQLSDGSGTQRKILFERSYAGADFPDFETLLSRFLTDAGGLGADGIETAVFGVAGPVSANAVRLTNRPWTIEAGALAKRFGFGRVRLVNDFAAAAHGVELIGESDLVTLQRGDPEPLAPRVVIGAGTGLGVAFVFRSGGRSQVVEGEGGNAGFAPSSTVQVELWRYIHQRVGRVSTEDVVSGRGLVAICEFLREREPASASRELAHALQLDDAAAAVAALAEARRDSLADRAMELLVQAYGAAAGDSALAVLARGGVYVAGGIAPKIISRLQRGGFIAAFRAKGRFAPLMASMPVHVVMSDRVGLLGAAAIAAGNE